MSTIGSGTTGSGSAVDDDDGATVDVGAPVAEVGGDRVVVVPAGDVVEGATIDVVGADVDEAGTVVLEAGGACVVVVDVVDVGAPVVVGGVQSVRRATGPPLRVSGPATLVPCWFHQVAVAVNEVWLLVNVKAWLSGFAAAPFTLHV